MLPGFSSATSLLCLYYLFKHWKSNASHYTITSFTVVLSLYNIVAAVLRSQAGYWDDCSSGGTSESVHLTSPDSDSGYRSHLLNPGTPLPGPSLSLSLAQVPVFLWFSDAFLVSCFNPLLRPAFHPNHIVISGLGSLDPSSGLCSNTSCYIHGLRR